MKRKIPHSTIKKLKLPKLELGADIGNQMPVERLDNSNLSAGEKAKGVFAGLAKGITSFIPGVGDAVGGALDNAIGDNNPAYNFTAGASQIVGGTTAAILTGGQMGTKQITQGVGETLEGGSAVANRKGNEKAANALQTSSQVVQGAAPIVGAIGGKEGGFNLQNIMGIPQGKYGLQLPKAEYGKDLKALNVEQINDGFDTKDLPTHEEGGVVINTGDNPNVEVQGKGKTGDKNKQEYIINDIVFSGEVKDGKESMYKKAIKETKKFGITDKKKPKLDLITQKTLDDKIAKLGQEQESIKQKMGLTENLPQAKYGKKLPKYSGGGLVPETLDLKTIDSLDSGLNFDMSNMTKVSGLDLVNSAKPKDKNKTSLTPGDKAQIAGVGVAPFANSAAVKAIRDNITTMRKETFSPGKPKISSRDTETSFGQDRANITAASNMSGKGGAEMKRAGLSGITKAISDNRLQTDKVNAYLEMEHNAYQSAQEKSNIATDLKNQESIQNAKYLAIATGLKAAEQVGTGLEKVGKTMNQGLTNEIHLKSLKETFPNYDITSENINEFIKAERTGKMDTVTKYRK